jgi:hypothetical protein
LDTGSQWCALSTTGICSKSSAHRRFTEWVEAGVFYEFWRQGLLIYDGLVGTDWVAIGRRSDDQDSVGWEKNRLQRDRPGQVGSKRSVVTDACEIPIGLAVDRANVPDYKLLEATLDALPAQRPEAILD